jgi:hypothetical protein
LFREFNLLEFAQVLVGKTNSSPLESLCILSGINRPKIWINRNDVDWLCRILPSLKKLTLDRFLFLEGDDKRFRFWKKVKGVNNEEEENMWTNYTKSWKHFMVLKRKYS